MIYCKSMDEKSTTCLDNCFLSIDSHYDTSSKKDICNEDELNESLLNLFLEDMNDSNNKRKENFQEPVFRPSFGVNSTHSDTENLECFNNSNTKVEYPFYSQNSHPQKPQFQYPQYPQYSQNTQNYYPNMQYMPAHAMHQMQQNHFNPQLVNWSMNYPQFMNSGFTNNIYNLQAMKNNNLCYNYVTPFTVYNETPEQMIPKKTKKSKKNVNNKLNKNTSNMNLKSTDESKETDEDKPEEEVQIQTKPMNQTPTLVQGKQICSSINSIEDLLNSNKDIPSYINSQKGSKKLQKILEEDKDDPSFVDKLFDVILTSLGKISNHNFGNYLCQSLLNKIGKERRIQAWKFYLKRNFPDYALHQFGNHSIQALVKCASSEEEQSFVVSVLKKYFNILIYDKNGCFILQKVLKYYKFNKTEILEKFILKNIYNLSQDKHASNIVKLYITRLTDEFSLNQQKLVEIISFRINDFLNDNIAISILIKIVDNWKVERWSRLFTDLPDEDIAYYMTKNSQNCLFKKMIAKSKESVSLYI